MTVAAAWPSFTSPLAPAGLKAIPDQPDLRGPAEFKDQQDRKDLPESRDLQEHKDLLDLLAQQERLGLQEQLDPQDQSVPPDRLELRDQWDFPACKALRDRKVNRVPRDPLVPPHLAQTQIPQWLV
jgi:hypothetical protein